ncbi:gliding motility-associated C-terminal domain-containing protein [Hymenobacter arizonensis]|uniref:Gliding motility-associated C-terminal domain-containing protein n=1 Tax=Hymenobacter arizonensis TaxID=1227077 RepID=A0A1I5T4A4_HYMAR|nr:gliding motility-associated C-terminal domain-containing protein [Hymenobacter arizonensis]SFP77843.1 gliding motility-associated C-terminal domain-containing protein [Hymenobacter arizonensis]
MPSALLRYAFVLVGLCLFAGPCWAQREYYNWYFGNRAGITFNGGVSPLTDSGILGPGSVSMSDSAGRFVFASDNYSVLNRQGAALPNGDSIAGRNFTNVNGMLSVRQPGHASRYYLFHSINVRGGLFYPAFSYSVVDMSANAGLGRVVEKSISVRLPGIPNLPSGQLQAYSNSDFALVRHANGRDQWLVLQNSQRRYLSYLLGPAGLDTIPVLSLVPRERVHGGVSGVSAASIRAAPNGRKLVLSEVEHSRSIINQQVFLTKYLVTELTDFDPQTGRVSNPTLIVENFVPKTQRAQFSFLGVAGLAFSPDGSKLYLDTIQSREIWQYDLLAGSPAAIGASRMVCGRLQNAAISTSNLQLGPDGKIYAANGQNYLGRINTPNARGLASQYQDSAIFLGSMREASHFLPRTTNDLNLPPVVVTGAGSIAAGTICAGETVNFVSSLSPFLTAAAYSWNFGDAASGPLNTAAGQAPAHRYDQSGTYTVTLRVTATDGQQFTTTQSVRVLPVPQVVLLGDTILCESSTRLLSASEQPMGSTYRWQDGSTNNSFTAAGSGLYQVTVTNPLGCSATATIKIRTKDCPDLPNIITPNADGLNEVFVLRGLQAPQWRLQVYNRWGQGIYEADAYANDWKAGGQPAGVYYYLLTKTASGQKIKGWLEVKR